MARICKMLLTLTLLCTVIGWSEALEGCYQCEDCKYLDVTDYSKMQYGCESCGTVTDGDFVSRTCEQEYKGDFCSASSDDPKEYCYCNTDFCNAPHSQAEPVRGCYQCQDCSYIDYSDYSIMVQGCQSCGTVTTDGWMVDRTCVTEEQKPSGCSWDHEGKEHCYCNTDYCNAQSIDDTIMSSGTTMQVTSSLVFVVIAALLRSCLIH